MGINFGRMAQGLATGYLGAAIKDKEAKDNARMEVVKAAGIDFETNIKPAHQKEMKLFESDYNMVATVHGEEIANLFGDQPGFFGTGKGLDNVNSILEKKNITKDDIKNFKFSTFEERKTKRISEFDKKQSAINAITGIGGTGPKVAEMQLEGFGEAKPSDGTTIPATVDMGTIEKEVEGTSDTTQDTPINQDVSTLFTPKAAERGVESKYKQIPLAINEKYGYGENIKMENGEYKFQPTGTMAKTANAHIALAEIISSNDESINQYGAADEAKNMLINLTEMPFLSLEKTLGGKYTAGNGGTSATIGTGNINANEIQYNGQPISAYLVDFVINQIPTDKQGNINKAVIDKFIENIPSNLMYSKDESMAERLDRKVKEQNFYNTYK